MRPSDDSRRLLDQFIGINRAERVCSMRSTRVLYVDFRVDRVTLHQRFHLQSRQLNWLRKRIAADYSPFMAGESIVPIKGVRLLMIGAVRNRWNFY